MNYKNMTEEEITYQLKWSDEKEFGTNYAKFLREENKQLKEKIDKAIEYIKENKASLPMGRDEFTCEMRYSDDVVLAEELLEILGDKE